MNARKIIIEGKEYDLPEGVTQISDDGLYAVNWSLIEIAPDLEDTNQFKFFNPRHLGQYECDTNSHTFLGQGFDKESMTELLLLIKKNGLECALLGYWALVDGKIKVRVNDGERRWRCLDRLRNKNEEVWSEEKQKFLPAEEVYASVCCRVKSMTDEEALERACSVSETSVKWGDAAYARLVKKLYEMGKTDEQVSKLLNKGNQWIAETYSLNDLDEFSFKFLLEDKINRKVALDLLKIKEPETRKIWLTDAWKEAVEKHNKLQAKADQTIANAEDEEEIATAELEVAKHQNKPTEEIQTLETKVAEAEEKTKKRKQAKAASAKPVIKSKTINSVSGGAFGKVLRPLKIKKKLQAVKEKIVKKDYTLANESTLKVLEVAYQCILDGIDNIDDVLKKI